jgi:uncharacterized protein YbjT (DUF2867 family)
MADKIVVVGGAGNLGSRICSFLSSRKAVVHVLVRKTTNTTLVDGLANVSVHRVDFSNAKALVEILRGSSCVVSALSGLRDVMIDAQTEILNAMLSAGVRRFIPSDYCIDYRQLRHGTNRNLDLRREFSTVLDSSGIKGTSILNGMFTDLLRGDAPVILPKQKRILAWGNVDQKMDFTSIDNTAEFTAEAALDDSSPRWLAIAGEEASMRNIADVAESVYGERFRILRPGGLAAFQFMIKVTKAFAPGKDEIYPAWQGMQYMHDMLSGLPKHKHLDNNRYRAIRWDAIADVLGTKDD